MAARHFLVLLLVAVGGCSTGAPLTGSGTPAEVEPGTTAISVPAPSMAELIQHWEDVAGDHFKVSARALEQVSAAGAGDDAAIRDGCTVLHDTNAVGLQGHLPTPDPALTAELQQMIDDMNTATHACLRFIDAHAAADAANYQDYLGRAVAHLGRAKAVLDADRSGR